MFINRRKSLRIKALNFQYGTVVRPAEWQVRASSAIAEYRADGAVDDRHRASTAPHPPTQAGENRAAPPLILNLNTVNHTL